MALIEREAAVDLLPVMSEFRPIMVEAWNEWLDLPAKTKSKLTPSCRATVVHDLTVDAATRRLGSSARLYDKAGLKLFVFEDTVCLRFKKHDADFVARNQLTQQVKNFLAQQPLEDIPAVHNLEVGYILDQSETSIKATNLICPNGHGNRPYWYIELKDEGYQCSVIDLFDPEAPNNDTDAATPSRWKARDTGVLIPFKRNVKPDGQP